MDTTNSPRENMISTAVRFLNDPKVQESSLEKRISFLQGKGLTKEEIEIALKQAADSIFVVPPPIPTRPLMINSGIKTAAGISWKDFILVLISAAGVTTGTLYIIKNYFTDYFPWGSNSSDINELKEDVKKLEEQMKDFESDAQTLDKNMKKAIENFQEIEVLSNKATTELKGNLIQDEISQVTKNVQELREMIPQFIEQSKANTQILTDEVAKEINSLKFLIKGSNFTGNDIPIIPSWQMEMIKDKSITSEE